MGTKKGNDDLVTSVITVNSGRVLHVVLCSEHQLKEIKSSCFNKQYGSALSFDKTYNLGSLYVTVGVYHNLALQRVGSCNVRIFIGPLRSFVCSSLWSLAVFSHTRHGFLH